MKRKLKTNYKKGGAKDFKPHVMIDPATGQEFMASTYEDHIRYSKLGYTHHKKNKNNEQYLTGGPIMAAIKAAIKAAGPLLGSSVGGPTQPTGPTGPTLNNMMGIPDLVEQPTQPTQPVQGIRAEKSTYDGGEIGPSFKEFTGIPDIEKGFPTELLPTSDNKSSISSILSPLGSNPLGALGALGTGLNMISRGVYNARQRKDLAKRADNRQPTHYSYTYRYGDSSTMMKKGGKVFLEEGSSVEPTSYNDSISTESQYATNEVSQLYEKAYANPDIPPRSERYWSTLAEVGPNRDLNRDMEDNISFFGEPDKIEGYEAIGTTSSDGNWVYRKIKEYVPNMDTDLSAYLQSKGESFKFSDRKILAKEYGVKDYKGTAKQNLELLDMVKKGKPTSVTSSKTSQQRPIKRELKKNTVSKNKPVINKVTNKQVKPKPSPLDKYKDTDYVTVETGKPGSTISETRKVKVSDLKKWKGDYKIVSNPSYRRGGEVFLEEDEIQKLLDQGYELEYLD